MDHEALEDLSVDVERGRVTSEEDGQTQNLVNGPTTCILGSNLSVGNGLGASPYVEVIIRGEDKEEHRTQVEKKHMKKKPKKANCKKASKPPRPPRAPSLDATDLMLVKEISAQAMNKRARSERIKALRKMREDKSSFSSSRSSISALIITVLFVLVMFFHGFCSRGINSVSFNGSPEPAAKNLITVQFFNKPTLNDGGGLGSSSSPVEQTADSNFPHSE